jgi:hypothetical protein
MVALGAEAELHLLQSPIAAVDPKEILVSQVYKQQFSNFLPDDGFTMVAGVIAATHWRTINQTPIRMTAMPPSLDKSIGC